MALFQGLLFLVLGIGLLAVDYAALASGWLPCGPNGLKGRLEIHRTEKPLAYWLLFGMYATGGIALAIFALRLLAGDAEPLPLAAT